MTKTCPYINQNDVEMRLHGTYCMYDGKVVYVTVNTGFNVGSLTIYPAGSGMRTTDAKIIDITDPKFSFVFPELGYTNFNKTALFLSKRPDRVQKQGLTTNTLIIVPHNKEQAFQDSLAHLLGSKEFQDSLDNKYPSAEAALHAIKTKDVYSAAISKHVALATIARGMLALFYNTRPIGMYNPKRRMFSITEDRMPSLLLSKLNRLGINYE